MPTFGKTARNKVRRLPKRESYDKAAIYEIIDEALICHVGFVQGNQPFVIPTIHARRGDELILHGATTSRMLKHIAAGNQVCIAITHLDGLVMARSVFHNSMNYRSVVLFGCGHVIESEEERLEGLRVLTDHVMPGRWAEARLPNSKELKATTLIAIPIESASAKVRTGPPADDEEDYAMPIWAGVLPIQQQFLAPINDPRLASRIEVPPYIRDRERSEMPPSADAREWASLEISQDIE